MRIERVFCPNEAASRAAIFVATTLTLMAFCVQPLAAQSHKDGKIYAVYKIDFNGIPLGKFRFRSDVSEKQYSMSGSSKFTFLNGLLFKWKGSVHSSGILAKKGPSPAKFSYTSKTNRKKESIELAFAGNAVQEVIRKPFKKRSKKEIPLLQSHLQNVVDPMSALMILTETRGIETTGQEICNRRMPVFDGQQRFDLQLSFKRKAQVRQKSGSSFSSTAYVCRVKYRPIAGYKPNKSGIKYMAKSDDIEVWLVPVRKAKMYVPYKIVLPTIAGYATATAKTFQIDQPGLGRLAMNSN